MSESVLKEKNPCANKTAPETFSLMTLVTVVN